MLVFSFIEYTPKALFVENWQMATNTVYNTDMPGLPIPAGVSRFGSFNLYPAQFLKYCRNSRF